VYMGVTYYRCIGEPHRELINAASIFSGPEGSHRGAGKDAREYGPEGVDDHNSHRYPIDGLKGLCCKDSAVLQENRAFGQPER
jgi:hypothetical protein